MCIHVYIYIYIYIYITLSGAGPRVKPLRCLHTYACQI